ncbi:nuclear transport factor 2 family protein [Salmonella enterica subsp. enterica serovar Typhi]|nr:nuclear transport factor 2 family protein [Salmonella enterica subsp. enterica serovar Typhi]EBW2250032.1 nuclear transport factor 2 family protein [Salmonella enterica subsp. enterica serovar Enteritidis]MIL10140.1 nuclear transport factor 2 family protein [Salmonella enterica subsp. enterica serovar Enteritidis]
MLVLPPAIAAYIDAYNRHDVQGMLDCLNEDVSFRNVSEGRVTARTHGKAAFAELAQFGADAFSTRSQTVVNAITVLDTTLVEIDYAATVAMDLPNGWKAGQRLTLQGASLFCIREHKIAAIIDQS